MAKYSYLHKIPFLELPFGGMDRLWEIIYSFVFVGGTEDRQLTGSHTHPSILPSIQNDIKLDVRHDGAIHTVIGEQ